LESPSSSQLINSITDALHYFIEKCCDYRASPIGQFKGERGPIAMIVKCKDDVCYVMLKKDWFYSFSRIYSQVPAEDSGIGQSFNMRMLAQAAQEGAFLVCVMRDRKVYHMKARDALDYITELDTQRMPSTENTIEGSIPAKMLQRMICE
jgi:hypothetical protein